MYGLKIKFAVLLLFSVLISGIVQAEQGSLSYIYDAENCDFTLSLPDEPFEAQRCHSEFNDQCENMLSFTHVYDLAATLNVFMNCRAADEETYHNFTESLMRATLIARAGTQLEEQEVSFAMPEGQGFKTASLMGAGQRDKRNGGVEPILYISQLWISGSSLLTFEAELTGPGIEKADRDLAAILHSIQKKN